MQLGMTMTYVQNLENEFYINPVDLAIILVRTW